MAQKHILYAHPQDSNCLKTLIAIKFSSNQNVEVFSDAPNFVLGKTNKSSEYLKKFPLGKVPSLETKDGEFLFESEAISAYRERISRADISIFCSLLQAYKLVFDSKFLFPYGNLARWFKTVANAPEVFSVVGKVELCKEMLTTPPADPPKNIKKEKVEKKKKETKKDDPEDEEGDECKEPEFKDPLASLPPGKFVLDEFKRFYSNNDEKDSVAFFFDKFDPEHYSLWFSQYKFPEELQKVYMSCNLITGMFQRLDKMRKNAFASVVLFGDDSSSNISGLWLWRGHDLAFKLSPDWQIDYESYDWKKLDYSSEDTKKLVTEFLSWEGDFGGMKFNQGKIFK